MPEPGAAHRETGVRLTSWRAACCLLLCAGAAPAAQTVGTVAITGLPTGVAPEALLVTLEEKAGAACTKELQASDCATIVDALRDLGYLEAQVKATAAALPGGARLVYSVTARSLVTIDSAQAPGLAKPDVQQLLNTLSITKETPCDDAVRQRLCAALAERWGINALFVSLSVRVNPGTHAALLVFSQ